MHEDPFDNSFMRRLDMLELAFRRLKGGQNAGDSTGRGRGGRTEFREHRSYTWGDDFRSIDWNVYGRTTALFVKEHAREERRTVRILLDCSASMEAGRPSKLHRGCQLAAAFAYLALVAGDEAIVQPFAENTPQSLKVAGQKHRINEVFELLRSVEPGGQTDVGRAVASANGSARHQSLVVLISDLLVASEDCRRSLAVLASRGYDLSIVHLLAPDEAAPTATGRLHLRDAETGELRRLWVEVAELQQYHKIVAEFIEGWEQFCTTHGMAFVSTTTSTPFDELLLGYMRRGGLIK